MKWMAAVDQSGLDDFPLIGNGDPSAIKNRDNSHGVWHIQGCNEIKGSGWYQPLMLNHAALERLRVPSLSYGLSDTCRNFVVTHDVGVEPYAWLLEMVHIALPGWFVNGEHKGIDVIRPDYVVRVSAVFVSLV